MRELLEENLLTFKRRTITIDELEDLLPAGLSYETFAEIILELEHDSTLQMVKTKGRNWRTPSIAYHYRINKHQLNRSFYQLLQTYRNKFHDAIDLDAYFKLDHNIWSEDLPYLEKINTYIERFGFPTEKVPAPERSFELVGDEKWIEEKGSDVLHRTQLWEKMNIYPVSDPVMFALNSNCLQAKQQLHLIVENKTTYQALVPVLIESLFSTLIYGVGNKISKSIENFPNQYPVEAEHVFLYFGDIDSSGITIWHQVHERQPVFPAVPFYAACLEKPVAYGKTNQRQNERALSEFLDYFSDQEREKIHELLQKGAYYPQEALQTKELQYILLHADWSVYIEQLK